MVWKYYLPDSGENASGAAELAHARPIDAEDAARIACEIDYAQRDGWERGDREFDIVVIDPDGVEHAFVGVHEPSVEHRVYEK